MKKVLSILLSICMLISVFTGFTTIADARYANDTNDYFSAYSFGENNIVSCSYKSSIWYSFTAPKSGYYKLSVKLDRCEFVDSNRYRVMAGTTETYMRNTCYSDHELEWEWYDHTCTYKEDYRWKSCQAKYINKKDGWIDFYFEVSSKEKIYVCFNGPYNGDFDTDVSFKIEHVNDCFKEVYQSGLYYRINTGEKTASVIGPTSERYMYKIPQTIVVYQKEYTVNEIDSYAFNFCSDLEEVYLPDTIKYIGVGAFARCNNLKIVDIKDNGYFKYQDGVLFNSKGNTLIWYPASLENEKYVIPNNVDCIYAAAFQGAKNLKSVVIPNSITSIDEYTFDECGLKTLAIPNSVVNIGQNAFSNNIYLKELTLGANVEIIGNSAFEKCSILRDVTLPNSVKEVENCAFSNCSKLTSCTVESSTTRFGVKVFDGCPESLFIYSADDSRASLYAKDENINWSTNPKICNHKYSLVESIDATCKNSGIKYYVCGLCKTGYYETVPQLAHEFKKTVIVATCQNPGYTMYSCNNCNYSYISDFSPLLNHSVVEDTAISSTYTRYGKTVGSHCASCKMVFVKQKNISKKKLASPAKVKISAVSKGFKLSWAKLSASKGYEIQYSTNSKFTSAKKVTITKNSTVSKTVSKLTGKKKYYVRIRSYYKDANGTAYSAWVVKNVTTKK